MKVDANTFAISPIQQSTDNIRQQTKGNNREDKLVGEASKKNVKLVTDKLNNFIEPIVHNIKFVYHEDLHEYYVTVVDPNTDEVIREIPPKKMLDMYYAMADYMGLLVDEKV
ncbi:MAG TPA: flagellar protein FlaG [Pseudogracilibacillus sp.]|nr:flagellar protein FlaG [Pseudogracilibacillus sp.]